MERFIEMYQMYLYLYQDFERDIERMVREGKFDVKTANEILYLVYRLAEDTYKAGFEDGLKAYEDIEFAEEENEENNI